MKHVTLSIIHLFYTYNGISFIKTYYTVQESYRHFQPIHWHTNVLCVCICDIKYKRLREQIWKKCHSSNHNNKEWKRRSGRCVYVCMSGNKEYGTHANRQKKNFWKLYSVFTIHMEWYEKIQPTTATKKSSSTTMTSTHRENIFIWK